MLTAFRVSYLAFMVFVWVSILRVGGVEGLAGLVFAPGLALLLTLMLIPGVVLALVGIARDKLWDNGLFWTLVSLLTGVGLLAAKANPNYLETIIPIFVFFSALILALLWPIIDLVVGIFGRARPTSGPIRRSTATAIGKLRLSVVCQHCGREFDTQLVLDQRSFTQGTLAANYFSCPHCGERRTYNKADYIVKEESGT